MSLTSSLMPDRLEKFDPETHAAVCMPICTLQELSDWRPSKRIDVSRVPYMAPRCKTDRPKVLVCHDMKGGYLEDRFLQGTGSTESYRFTEWWRIDTFVYFSHNFITIPPPSWIDAAHKHGVPVLGTLITEWEEGALKCKEFLQDEESLRTVADKLASIASVHNCDGWLVNIENPLEEKEVLAMVEFVDYLTKSMHSAVPHSQVIWYDSVVTSGKLKWQDELNHQNRCFFDVCDGIFLNYGWQDEELTRSSAIARQCNRPYDVYVGIDVYGRGCFGGGGFNTDKAMAVAHQHQLSIAIFAPGWVHETLQKKSFVKNDSKFWDLLRPYCPQRNVQHLPLVTSFCQGWGNSYVHGYNVIKEFPWSNMALQQLQPATAIINLTEVLKKTYYDVTRDQMVDSVNDTLEQPTKTPKLEQFNVSPTTGDAFRGGGCLGVTFYNTVCPSAVRLFPMDVCIDDYLFLSYTCKYDMVGMDDEDHDDEEFWLNTEMSLAIVLVCENDVSETVYVVCHDKDYEGECRFEANTIHKWTPEHRDIIYCKELVEDPVVIGDMSFDCRLLETRCSRWKTRKYNLEKLNGLMVHDVWLWMAKTGNDIDILLGEFKIIPLQRLKSFKPDLGTVQYKSSLLFEKEGSTANTSDCATSMTAIENRNASMTSDDPGSTLTLTLSWYISEDVQKNISHYHVYMRTSEMTGWTWLGHTPGNLFTKSLKRADYTLKYIFKVEPVFFTGVTLPGCHIEIHP